jgi:hypothetical protein
MVSSTMTFKNYKVRFYDLSPLFSIDTLYMLNQHNWASLYQDDKTVQ